MDQIIKEFFETESNTFTYVLADAQQRVAAIIDPVLSFDLSSGSTSTEVLDEVLRFLEQNKFELIRILETHAHADHMSGAQYLLEKTGAPVGIGKGIRSVQGHFKAFFNLEDFQPDGSQFDQLFDDGDSFRIGGIKVRVMATPGHTSDSVTYLAGNAAFVGDTLFMPDVGTARCDFPGGDAGQLYDSISKLLALPEGTRLHMCHDYPPNNRELRFVCTVADQKSNNIHVGGGRGKAEFVSLRQKRDATLSVPRLILPSLQVNIRAGHLPGAEQNGVVYLKIPLDQM